MGTSELFDRLEKAHDEASDGAIKIHIYRALGEAPTPELRKRALEMCLTDKVRSQDMIYLPMSVAVSGKAGGEYVFEWVKSEYDRIFARLGATSMILFQHIARISGSGFVTNEHADEVFEFWKSKPIYSQLEKAVAQTVEGIKSNSKFVERLKASDVSKPEAWAISA